MNLEIKPIGKTHYQYYEPDSYNNHSNKKFASISGGKPLFRDNPYTSNALHRKAYHSVGHGYNGGQGVGGPFSGKLLGNFGLDEYNHSNPNVYKPIHESNYGPTPIHHHYEHHDDHDYEETLYNNGDYETDIYW